MSNTVQMFSKMWQEELLAGSNLQTHILLNFLTCIKAVENIMKCVTKNVNLDRCHWLQQSWIRDIYGTDITHEHMFKWVTEAAKVYLTHIAKGKHLEKLNKIHKLCIECYGIYSTGVEQMKASAMLQRSVPRTTQYWEAERGLEITHSLILDWSLFKWWIVTSVILYFSGRFLL